jgi:hypothetical protein
MIMALNSYTPNPADSTPHSPPEGVIGPSDIQDRRPGLLGILIGLLLFSLAGILIGLLLFTIAPLSIAGGAVNALSGGSMCDVNGDAPYAPLGSFAGLANGIDALRATGGGAPLIDFCKLPAVQSEPGAPANLNNPNTGGTTGSSGGGSSTSGDGAQPVADCWCEGTTYVCPNGDRSLMDAKCILTPTPACLPGLSNPNDSNCTETDEPACIYNGMCDPGENTSLCPNDCPPPGGPICGAICYSDGDCAGLGPNPKCVPNDRGYGTCYDDLKCGQGDGSSTNDGGGDQGGNNQGGNDQGGQCTETKCGDQKCDAACGENPNSCAADCK